jgi:hypothetical protein
MAEADVEFPLVHASAEATPFDDSSFDIVYVPLRFRPSPCLSGERDVVATEFAAERGGGSGRVP